MLSLWYAMPVPNSRPFGRSLCSTAVSIVPRLPCHDRTARPYLIKVKGPQLNHNLSGGTPDSEPSRSVALIN